MDSIVGVEYSGTLNILNSIVGVEYSGVLNILDSIVGVEYSGKLNILDSSICSSKIKFNENENVLNIKLLWEFFIHHIRIV